MARSGRAIQWRSPHRQSGAASEGTRENGVKLHLVDRHRKAD